MIAPKVQTERLLLRGFETRDLPALTDFFTDRKATRYIGGAMSAESIYMLLCAFVGHWVLYGLGLWAIEEKKSGALAGYTGYINPRDWPFPEIGWSIFPMFQSRGYATEAALAARDEIARLGGPRRLVSYIDPQNAPSRRVAEKLGAVPGETIGLRGGRVTVWRHPPSVGGRVEAVT